MLRSFYMSLPTLKGCKDFYVPGYTEALTLFSDVRVVPNSCYIEGTDAAAFRKYFFAMKSLPVYWIPIFYDRKCYGFVLKNNTVKVSVRFKVSDVFSVPGIERVRRGSLVFMAEGLKDVGPLLSLGYVSLPMLTSVPSLSLLMWLREQGCKVVVVPDHDEHERKHLTQIGRRFRAAGFEGFRKDYLVCVLEGPADGGKSDLGDFYGCKSQHDLAVTNLKSIVSQVRSLGWR